MTDEDIKKLRGVVKTEIGTAVKPINAGLGQLKTGLNRVERRLDILWEQVGKVTGDLENIKDKLSIHTNYLKKIDQNVDHNSENVRGINKRLRTVENQLGIVPPPELNIIE